MKSRKFKVFLLLAVVCLAGLFYFYDLGQYLNLKYIKENQQAFQIFYSQKPFYVISIFFGFYILSTALSLPGAVILTLAAGALFGLVAGTIIVSFASTIGATGAFLAARFLLRDQIQGKFGEKLKTINEGVEKEGVFYLFSLRLIPIFPFFIINLVMGLTPIRTLHFFMVSQIGMLPGTIVYVNAGTQIAQIDSLKGILSPQLLFSFALLGLFPLMAKKAMDYFKRKTL